MILDYLTEYGMKSFYQEPLNYLDLLALDLVLDFTYDPPKLPILLSSALDTVAQPTVPLLGTKHKRVASMPLSDEYMLIALLQEMPRYKDVVLLDYQEHFVENVQQFGAMSLRCDGITMVFFRGTDGTLTGWKESLKLPIETQTSSERDAVLFLTEQITVTSDPVLICGHSKGGFLATYAATVFCTEYPDKAGRLAKIVSFDGLGMPDWVRALSGYTIVAPLITTFIPASSIVGNLMKHPHGSVITIESTAKFAAQHVPYTWKTAGTCFVSSQPALDGRLASGAINVLIDNLTDQQQSKLFDAAFALPQALGTQILFDPHKKRELKGSELSL